MKNKIICLIIFCSFFIAQNSFAKTTFPELKKAAHHPKLTKKQEAKIKRYLSQNTSSTIKKGLKLLLEKKLDKKLIKAKNIISNFKIDGKISDWKHTGLIKKDDKNDTLPIDKKKDEPKTKGIDDLKSYGFIMDENYIYTMVKPYKMPAKNETYHYQMNLVNQKGHIIYVIFWTSQGNYIQEWNPATGKYVKDHYLPDSIFAKKNIFEAKIPIAKLINLPYFFAAEGIVWHEHRNKYDYSWQTPFEQPIEELYKKASADLFFEYTKKIKLKINDPFPVVQALTDGFVYKFANNNIKQRVINDGIKMIRYAKNISYAFPEQITLSKNNLEALLAWANRSFSYGIYSNYYLADNKKLNKAVYNFMFMDPNSLKIANSLIKNNNFYDSTNLDNTIYQIETWITDQEKYRAQIKRLKHQQKYNSYLRPIYLENLYEQKHHQRVITKINGFKIKKDFIYSPTFQIKYLQKHNFFYGNCGDVAIVAEVFYKALGIPVFSLSYNAIAKDFFYSIHTFPVYYSSQDDKWFNYTRNGNPVYDWAKPKNNAPYQIFYTVNHPQIGSYWEDNYQEIKNNNIWSTTNRPYKIISENSWQEINEQGYPMSSFKKMIYK